jgi:hypothetical protein
VVVSPFQVKPGALTADGQQLLDSLPCRRGRFLCQVQLVELAFRRRRLRTLRDPDVPELNEDDDGGQE